MQVLPWPRQSSLRFFSPLIPLLGGALIAVAATGILRLPYVWAALVAVGLTVCVLSLTVKDFESYWLAIFALALPLEITKSLVDSEYLRDITTLHGIPLGEMPAPFIYLSDLAFAVLLLYWLYGIIRKENKVFFPRSNWLALAFISWAALSLINAPVFSYGFFDLLRLIKLYCIYIYIANIISTEARARSLMNFLFAGMILQGLICTYQLVAGDTSYLFGDLFGKKEVFSEEVARQFQVFEGGESQIKRASGTVGPSNAQAQYFELLLPMVFVLWFTASRLRNSIVFLFLLTLGTAGLVATFSRGGLVALAAGFLAVFVLARAYSLVSSKKFLSVLLSCLIVVILLSPSIYDYVMSRPEATQVRIHLYKVGLNMIEAHPFLGVGLNSHLVVAPQIDPDSYHFPTPTHNQYILTASEVGIPGLAFYLAFLISVGATASRIARSDNLYLAAIGLGILGALVAAGVHSTVDHFTYHTNLTLLWLFAGLSEAMSRMTSPGQPGVSQ